jgi:hypothetical protein
MPDRNPFAEREKRKEKGFRDQDLSRYRYAKYFYNQDLFRPYIFKNHHPEWESIWRPLEHLVFEYEQHVSAGLAKSVSLRPGDDKKIEALLRKKCSVRSQSTIDTLKRMGQAKEELARAFCTEYKKAYRVAKERAHDAFMKSDFRHSWEYYAHKFGFVKPGTPYKSKLRGQIVVEKGRVYLKPRGKK